MANIVLFYSPMTRSSRPRWLLEELQITYDLKLIDVTKGEHKNPDYIKNVHPLGLVPAMTIDGHPLIESSAMCLYLADKYSEKNLAPAIHSPSRAQYYQWIFFSTNHLEPELVTYFRHTKKLPEATRSATVANEAKEAAENIANTFENHLKKNEFILGNVFSAADIVIGSSLLWGSSMKFFMDKPAIKSYVERLKTRPAWMKAQQL